MTTFVAGRRIKAVDLNAQAAQLIQNTVLTASQASIQFNPVASSYNNLMLKWHARTTSANTSDNMQMQINGDTGNNYDWQILAGLNAAVSTTPGLGDSKLVIGTCVGGAGTAHYFSNGQLEILGWSQASATHIVTCTGTWYACWSNSAATSQVGTCGGLYTPSSAATSLSLAPAAGSFAAGSVFSLYGLA